MDTRIRSNGGTHVCADWRSIYKFDLADAFGLNRKHMRRQFPAVDMRLESGNQAFQNHGCLAGSGHTSTQRNIRVDCGTMGKIIDAGVKDPNQMGSAMAPAAVDTILNHLDDTGRSIDYYDLILTGDLGYIGKDIACDLLKDAGLPARTVEERLDDCGTMMYYRDTQDVHGGASGCGCSASVFSGNILSRMASGELSRVLLISTGAMLSTISPFQGESIPGIAHLLNIKV